MLATLSREAAAPMPVQMENVALDNGVLEVSQSLQQLVPGTARYAAFREVVPVTPLTPLWQSALPEDLRDTGFTILVKDDARDPKIDKRRGMPGLAYKLRGFTSGLLAARERDPTVQEVVVASTGNHANAAAIAVRALGFGQVHAYMPEDASPVKRYGISLNGAQTHILPELLDCIAAAQEHGERPGAVFIHPFDHPDVIAGQGTITPEIAEQAEHMGLTVDHLLFPGGGGGDAAGNKVASIQWLPNAQIGVVQSEGAADIVAKLKGHTFDISQFNSACDGAAVPTAGALAMHILGDKSSSVNAETVTLAEIGEAMAVFARPVGITEPAGALALAGALKMMRTNPGGSGVIVVHRSGANVTPEKVQEFMQYAFHDDRIDSRTAYEIISQAYAERPISGTDELLLKAAGNGALGLHGCRVASGPTAGWRR